MTNETFSTALSGKKDTNEEASLVFRFLRMAQIKSKYKFKHLEEKKLTQDHVYVVGNDPAFDDIEENATDIDFAIVATSGLRALKLGLRLAKRHQVPKIFIIDNSSKVIRFWKYIKRIAEVSKSFSEFYYLTAHMIAEPSYQLIIDYYLEAHLQNLLDFMRFFEDKIDYLYFQKMINKAIIVAQDWEDTSTFIKIKNICRYLNIEDIYVYPSNLIQFLEATYQGNKVQSILDNIAILKPKLSIHVTMGTTTLMPKHPLFLKDYSPSNIRKQLTLASEASDSTSDSSDYYDSDSEEDGSEELYDQKLFF